MSREEIQLEFHPIQLTGVWAAKIEGSRRAARDGDPSEPTFQAFHAREVRLVADGLGFSCTIRVRVTIPVLEGEVFRGEVNVVGQFATATETPLTLGVARAFCRRQALYLLWPFARTFLDQAAVIAGVGIPPLPMIVQSQ
jgi:hypothetical protein